MDKDVHDLKPGALAVVAHKMRPHELNGWIKRVVVNPNESYPSDLLFQGNLYMLDAHVPHGTIVLVLSHNSLRSSFNLTYSDYYQILWGDVKLFIRCERLINPYYNGESVS